MSITARTLPLAALLVAAACTGSSSGGSDPSTPPLTSGPPSIAPSVPGIVPSPPATTAATAATRTPTRTTSRPTSSPADPVGVFADCTTPTVRPSTIVLTCADGGITIVGIVWSRWDGEQARGRGSLRYNDCRPNCAQGTFHTVPGTAVTLTAPTDVGDGLVVWSRITEAPAPPGLTATQTLPLRAV